jgi:hypothetical protein
MPPLRGLPKATGYAGGLLLLIKNGGRILKLWLVMPMGIYVSTRNGILTPWNGYGILSGINFLVLRQVKASSFCAVMENRW